MIVLLASCKDVAEEDMYEKWVDNDDGPPDVLPPSICDPRCLEIM